MTVGRDRGIVPSMTTQKRTTVTEQLRAELFLSQLSNYRLEKLTGVSDSTLGKFKRGEGGIDGETVDRLAAYFGLRLALE